MSSDLHTSPDDQLDEFDLIHRFFAPLAEGVDGALDLRDDAAILPQKPGFDLVVTKDVIAEDIHFPKGVAPDLIARKLLRVNLSDLAAKGAQPLGYLIGGIFENSLSADWFEAFADGLAADQAEFGIKLYGGDTVLRDALLTLSLTAFGTVPEGEMLMRSGARPGDSIYVSGTLGDAAMGLSLLKQGKKQTSREEDFLIDRYHLPRPRTDLGQKLVGRAKAAMDISDGLAADLRHLCRASQCGALVNYEKIPLSNEIKTINTDISIIDLVLAGGDDYEILFTAPLEKAPEIESLSKELNVRLTPIGEIVEEPSLTILDGEGQEIHLQSEGYRHQLNPNQGDISEAI